MTFFACATAKNLSISGVTLPTSWIVCQGWRMWLDISGIYLQTAMAKFKTRGGQNSFPGACRIGRAMHGVAMI
jgi:hypothetical protein